MFSKIETTKFTDSCSAQIESLRWEIENTDAVMIGAGAGLSSAAGFAYTGDRFYAYFSDFARKYHFSDMYSGGFYPYETQEEHWAYWSRYIYINRYMDAPKPVYEDLFRLVQDKDYFVLTTNVDHSFQKSGFDKHRLFYTQGDYGLWQCRNRCGSRTSDNEAAVRKMVESQGFVIAPDGSLVLPEGITAKTCIPTELVPICPDCGQPMTMNLRCDDSFVQDEGWDAAAARYAEFNRAHENGRVLYLELGVGMNTPAIIKYPFWRRVNANPEAVYACLNLNEAYAPNEIAGRSICICADIEKSLTSLVIVRL